jgi:hypothetical protein
MSCSAEKFLSVSEKYTASISNVGARSKWQACFFGGYFLGLLFDPEDGGSMFLRIVNLYQTTRLDILFFLVTAVRISNPA